MSDQNPPPLDSGALNHQRSANQNHSSQAELSQALLAQTLAAALNSATVEARRKRRWGIFFKLLFGFFCLLFLVIFIGLKSLSSSDLYLDSNGNVVDRYSAVIDVKGVIADNSEASASRIIKGLQRAYQDPKVAGIILRINSGGGSPVQSGYVYDEIQRLQQLYPEKKVIAVIEDIGASGAYYIAAASDEIYADKASLVGSIGVTAAGFGFTQLIDKVGIERRLYTSGEYKAFLDPFSPQNAVETEFWQGVLDGVHQQFIKAVEAGRGDRLQRNYPNLYSGLIWNGEQALSIGLIDGLASPQSIAREKFAAPFMVDFTEKEDPFVKLMQAMGMGIATGVKTAFPDVGWQ